MRAVALVIFTIIFPILKHVDVSAQTGAPPQTGASAQPGASAQNGASAQPQAEIMKISLMVTDSSNKIIANVRPEDLRVVEGKKQLPVTFVARDARPWSYVICLDASGSMNSQYGLILAVAKALLENKSPDDEISIVGFISSDQIHTISKFNTNKSELLDSLKDVQIGGGQSAVIDGIYLSTEAMAEHRADDYNLRRAVVVISDGEDRSSYYTRDKLVNLVRDSDVQLFSIGLVTQLDNESGFIRVSPRERAESLLKTLADESAGRVFFPRNKEELIEATEQIILSLNSQYVVGFERQPKPGEKGFRKVKVSLIQAPDSPKLKVITRQRFWVGPRKPKKVKKDKNDG